MINDATRIKLILSIARDRYDGETSARHNSEVESLTPDERAIYLTELHRLHRYGTETHPPELYDDDANDFPQFIRVYKPPRETLERVQWADVAPDSDYLGVDEPAADMPPLRAPWRPLTRPWDPPAWLGWLLVVAVVAALVAARVTVANGGSVQG